jgi:hypothetical protein
VSHFEPKRASQEPEVLTRCDVANTSLYGEVLQTRTITIGNANSSDFSIGNGDLRYEGSGVAASEASVAPGGRRTQAQN